VSSSAWQLSKLETSAFREAIHAAAVVRTERFLADRQRALVNALRLTVLALGEIYVGELIQSVAHIALKRTCPRVAFVPPADIGAAVLQRRPAHNPFRKARRPR
jgi:hypothetical protein